jgi:hypothetical protein
MSHFTRERTDAAWYRGLKIPHTVIRNIDEKTKLGVSGNGGSWAPSSAIIIGGAGLELQSDILLSGTAKAQPGTGKNFVFGDDDYFRFSASRTRIIHDSPLLTLSKETLQREARPWSSVSTAVPSLRTKRPNARVVCPLRIPDGGRLSEIVIGFMVGQSHADVPTILPKARAIRIAADGTFTQHPYPTTSGHDPDGWVVPATPVSGAAWYNGGAIQTLTLTYDQTLLPGADTSLYGYAVEWVEESGTNAFADDVGNHLVYFKTTVYVDDMRPY